MSLRRLRPRHVYAASLAVFVALLGFEGARMAAGKDPALARPAASAPRDTSADPGTADPYGYDPDGGREDGDGDGLGGSGSGPGGSGGGSQPQEVPQPESRLS